ncbi:MAG: cytochrome c biogenesis protein CcsA [Salibacteraceae bacterium]
MDIAYVGERLWIGELGNLFLLLSFSSILLSCVAYIMARYDKDPQSSWLSLGRWGFRIHSLLSFSAIGLIFVMLANHCFEYHYVWQHSNLAMPMRYILSAFWEGQEGSFLLWIFWHIVLGNILIHTTKRWEAPVMAVFAMVQVVLASMVLGVYIFEYKIGSNPFAVLLREHPDFFDDEVFQFADYITRIDGRGLNPLLQNYWMTIHPPTLFLGFASTLIPFCFAMAGLWTRELTAWLKPAIPWTYFSIMILGTGILMGGAWAYEALSFGGFWAWDPVENASLVPWLTLVGAAHLMLIHRNKGTSLFMLFLLTQLSFLLVLYSTFLTRSGVLGDASVHAFTDLGMSGQLVFYLIFFVWLGFTFMLQNRKLQEYYTVATFACLIVYGFTDSFSYPLMLWFGATIAFLYIAYKRHFPQAEKEEELWSREFWMFVGALVLLVSAFQISGYTSIPVINKLTPAFAWLWDGLSFMIPDSVHEKLVAGSFAPKTDAEVYNNWQVPFAILVALFMAYGQFLRYKNTKLVPFLKKLTPSLAISVVISVVIAIGFGMTDIFFLLLLFTSVFAFVANADYALRMVKGKIRRAGASIAHIGFALILLGALISNGEQEFISRNATQYNVADLNDEYSNEENAILFVNDTVPMGDYFVSYRGKEQRGINFFYKVDYYSEDENQELIKEFTLEPFVQLNERMGNVPEPGTKHFWGKDIFTHITFAEVEETAPTPYKEPEQHKLQLGDTVKGSSSIFILDTIQRDLNLQDLGLDSTDLAVKAKIKVFTLDEGLTIAEPVFVLRGNRIFSIPDTVENGPRFSFDLINPAKQEYSITVEEKRGKEFIVMQAIMFPWINILWLGSVLLAIGTIIAVVNRIRLIRRR